MSGVTRVLNTENLVTRLYVEGSFGEDGYVGIESVNPTTMNFLLNFDYFKSIGLFTEQNEQNVEDYLLALKKLKNKCFRRINKYFRIRNTTDGIMGNCGLQYI